MLWSEEENTDHGVLFYVEDLQGRKLPEVPYYHFPGIFPKKRTFQQPGKAKG